MHIRLHIYILQYMRGNFIYKRLGERIVTERNLKHISQEQLALITDIDRTYLARIERGEANPTIKVLSKICRLLRVNFSHLFKGV